MEEGRGEDFFNCLLAEGREGAVGAEGVVDEVGVEFGMAGEQGAGAVKAHDHE